MIKRLFDFILSFILIFLFSPILILFTVIIWLQDFKPPFYIAGRVGKKNKIFKMIKFRSMIVGADKTGVDSTSSNDGRITRIGIFIRKYKIDELPNLINIFFGQMSFVGPRPNVKRETELYTSKEKKLLDVRPGMTDFSSIVFSDEGDILKDSSDPDLDYNQLIRPWKSRLGILYIEKNNILLDIKLIFLTAFAIISKSYSLVKINYILSKLSKDEKLISVCKRNNPLYPYSPPGSEKIVLTRK